MFMHLARLATEKAVLRPALPMCSMPGISEMQMKTPYFQKLKDPRWQKKRLEVLEANEWRCERCMDADNTLHVHHRQYFKGREPWDYEIGQLAVLCEDCHEATHEDEDVLQLVASYVVSDGPWSRDAVASLIAGFIGKGDNNKLVPDPHTYLTGALAYEMNGWSRGALAAFELEMLLDKIGKDRDSFMAHLRAFIGTTAPKGFDA